MCSEVRRSLGSKKKLCFIIDSTRIEKPKIGDKLYDARRQANDMVISWLVKSMNSTIRQSVIWMNFAKDIWLDFQQRYDRRDAYRISNLLEAFYS